jgi:hypothetical protein
MLAKQTKSVTAVLEVIAMMGIFWFSVCCFLWLVGLTLLAEVWFYEEEEEL